MTIYEPDAVPCRDESIVYLHGGGLIFGSREGVPEKLLSVFTDGGFRVIALDYPLAPHILLNGIVQDIKESIELLFEQGLLTERYFLWGRSSGAYLSLLLARDNTFLRKPSGILSFYGYGFLTDGWGERPAAAYTCLPEVSPDALNLLPEGIYASADMALCYPVYVYARQTGCWLQLVSGLEAKDFMASWSLRLTDKLPCPLFSVHCIHDPDVPYAETDMLFRKYGGVREIIISDTHDFDRDSGNFFAKNTYRKALNFMLEHAGR